MTVKGKKPGAGFAHLVPSVDELAAITQQAVLVNAPVSSVHVLPGFNPRGRYSGDELTSEKLQELVKSIREHGVLQPLWVRLRGGEYAVIAGERRYQAAMLADLTHLPVLNFGAVSDERAEELALIENAHRTNPSIVDQTLSGFKLLALRTKMSQEELVRYLNGVRKGQLEDTYGVGEWLQTTYGTGISVWAQQRSKILNFTPEELNAVQARQLDVKAVYALLKVENRDKRRELLAEAVQHGWKAEDVRQAVQALAPKKAHPLLSSVEGLRGDLPRLKQLTGKEAAQAQKLIAELRALLGQDKQR
ncbi:ParB/RepB/Spo0J family partition protein [Deinococcus sp. YIM 134068]|uniref:ParB/RepB/Spo0J family partition protein n=1 Tax=Deinococcus lichenicola TaxID=3118910 RepID=UPI002F936CE7